MAITVKKKSLHIKPQDTAETGETDLNDLPDLSALPPTAMMSGGASRKSSGEYMVTGILGLVALLLMIGVLVIQYNELNFYAELFVR